MRTINCADESRSRRTRSGAATFGEILTLALSICAFLVATAAYLRARADAPAAATALRHLDDWAQLSSTGHRLGTTNATKSILVFEDYQCPFCKIMHGTLKRMRAANPDIVVISRQFPLTSTHPHAMAAAIAAECASDQGRFEQFQDTVYSAQSQIGSVTWAEFANRSGVPDAPRFAKCVASDTGIRRRVQRDLDAALEHQLPGTPAIIVAGDLLTSPSDSLILRLLKRAK
ncbi:MAG: hypothetical protein JWM95_12 [Gemmatimonadetes bacterium]|nr:hypothetical protein [Gemmatimonadota bacterium]